MSTEPQQEPERRPPVAAPHATAMCILRKYVLISAGAGAVVTAPVLDVTVLAGVHVAMIKEITEHYGISFSEDEARAIIAAVAASLVPGSLGSLFGRRLLRALPFASPLVAVVLWGGASGVVSYLLGTLFIRHYEAGGTLATFDVEHLHAIFSRG